MKCNLSESRPCPNEAKYRVHWHMSFDPAWPCENYVCQNCIDTKPDMVVIRNMELLPQRRVGDEPNTR